MAIEVKSKIDVPSAAAKKWAEVYDALDKAPVGGGIQEKLSDIGAKSYVEVNNLFGRIRARYGKDTFKCSQRQGLVTIIRLKETK